MKYRLKRLQSITHHQCEAMHSLLFIFLFLTGFSYGHTRDLQSLSDTNPGPCIALHCPRESAACVLEPECRETLEVTIIIIVIIIIIIMISAWWAVRAGLT